MKPLSASLPGTNRRGRDSPVRAEVSTVASPSVTKPSSGIFSPLLTMMTSPTAISSGRLLTAVPFSSRQA